MKKPNKFKGWIDPNTHDRCMSDEQRAINWILDWIIGQEKPLIDDWGREVKSKDKIDINKAKDAWLPCFNEEPESDKHTVNVPSLPYEPSVTVGDIPQGSNGDSFTTSSGTNPKPKEKWTNVPSLPHKPVITIGDPREGSGGSGLPKESKCECVCHERNEGYWCCLCKETHLKPGGIIKVDDVNEFNPPQEELEVEELESHDGEYCPDKHTAIKKLIEIRKEHHDKIQELIKAHNALVKEVRK